MASKAQVLLLMSCSMDVRSLFCLWEWRVSLVLGIQQVLGNVLLSMRASMMLRRCLSSSQKLVFEARSLRSGGIHHKYNNHRRMQFEKNAVTHVLNYGKLLLFTCVTFSSCPSLSLQVNVPNGRRYVSGNV